MDAIEWFQKFIANFVRFWRTSVAKSHCPKCGRELIQSEDMTEEMFPERHATSETQRRSSSDEYGWSYWSAIDELWSVCPAKDFAWCLDGAVGDFYSVTQKEAPCLSELRTWRDDALGVE